MRHEPAEGAFHDPPAWQDTESGRVRVAAYYLDIDAQVGAVIDDLGVVAAAHPRFRHARSAVGDMVENLPADRGVGGVATTG